MRVSQCFGVAALVTIAVIGSAAAEERGLYLGLGGGGSFLQDIDGKGGGGSGHLESDTGWLALGTAGYRFGNGLRAEVEGAYRQNSADSAPGIVGSGSVGGSIAAWSLMTNVLYDFDLGLPVRPYLGVGIGAADVNADNIGRSGTRFNDDSWAFAYQGIAGVEYPMTDSLALFADYRYFSTAGLELRDRVGGASARTDDEYRDHAVIAGLRWTFGAPPPAATPVAATTPEPPAAPPAPQPAVAATPTPRDYLVFFDWNSAALTAEAQGIVRQAADNARSGGVSRLQVTGHADRSGPATYNMGLSKKRAEVVVGELVRDGVAQSQIGVAWKGETDPLVPTPDGVREPQNRRVQIQFL